MPFTKVLKNKAYFKRFQVKYRRRREGKTDYYARRRLVNQDGNKYDSPKYRFVVRISNKDIVCQIIYAKITGDFVLKAAYSHELTRYGLKVGLNNYAAAYCTGLLLARRLLKSLKLDEQFKGVESPDGKFFLYRKKKSLYKQKLARMKGEKLAKQRAPFKALLDVGLHRTTTGAKIFGALKGAVDGGISIPHSESRFAGYKKASGLNSEILRSYIYGGHVANYMNELKSKSSDRYQSQFSAYIKNEIEGDHLEELYKKVHAAIREKPEHVSSKKAKPEGFKQKRWNKAKLNNAQRKHRVNQKLMNFAKKHAAAVSAEEAK